jgi:hypothetical protein
MDSVSEIVFVGELPGDKVRTKDCVAVKAGVLDWMLLADTLSETQAVLETTWVRDRKPEPDMLGELDMDQEADCEGDSVAIELSVAEPDSAAVADPALV